MAQAKPNQSKEVQTRILLVDDHAVVRYGMAQLINRQPDLMVCGEEEDASRAMTAIVSLKPDLVIADISLKDSSGLELMRNIKAQYVKLPVLVVSGHDESIYAEIAFRAGALGYLMKEEALEKIVIASGASSPERFTSATRSRPKCSSSRSGDKPTSTIRRSKT